MKSNKSFLVTNHSKVLELRLFQSIKYKLSVYSFVIYCNFHKRLCEYNEHQPKDLTYYID